ncbi:MAG: hypothetical protein AAB074_09720 [Planctomycetota bacterium]
MDVITGWNFSQPREKMWPLLCNSRMEPVCSCLFGLGVPRPEECRLPEGHGGEGSARQCVSNQGTIEQRILEWREPQRLRFRMEETDMFFRRWVSGIEDSFDLESTATGGTRIVRTTRLVLKGRCRAAKSVALWIALKRIHRFVFRNWQRTAA